MHFPTVSIVMPTLNSQKTLTQALRSVNLLDYPKQKIEILIVDGGSSDDTVKIAKTYGAKVFSNMLKTSEAGKPIGVSHAKHELILFLDSDNEIPDSSWLKKMVKPFEDEDIIASEPLRYTWREKDSPISRYCALIGMNDPLCMFIGNYDRFNTITNTWTKIPVVQEQKEGYIKFKAKGKTFMTMGANGFLVRKKYITKYAKHDYYFDTDVAKELARRGHWFAKVDAGIVHHFADSLWIFRKKQQRRIKDFLYLQDKRNISFGTMKNSSEIHLSGIIYFSFSTLFLVPLVMQMIIGYSRKKDFAWFYHVPLCYITFFVYVSAYARKLLHRPVSMMDRTSWQN